MSATQEQIELLERAMSEWSYADGHDKCGAWHETLLAEADQKGESDG